MLKLIPRIYQQKTHALTLDHFHGTIEHRPQVHGLVAKCFLSRRLNENLLTLAKVPATPVAPNPAEFASDALLVLRNEQKCPHESLIFLPVISAEVCDHVEDQR